MISHFFIDRPIFAAVLSVVIVIVGGVALVTLPVAQYPEVAPPTVQVNTTYPGASAKTVADTVATPIEQEVNGVERMLYMSSKSTNDGVMNLDVTFELGTDLDTAQVLVQNRVSTALAKLPEEVKRIGVTTKKKSPSILLCVNLISPDGAYDQLYLSNFATLNVKDDLARIKGVGDVTFLGPRDYSMRIWLDPAKMASLDLIAGDVNRAIKEQNVQVAAGQLGQQPLPKNATVPFQLPINTQGRLSSEEQFAKIIVKTGSDGEPVYLKNLVRDTTEGPDGKTLEKGIELGAKNYDVNSFLGDSDKRYPAVTLALFQMPGSNALDTAKSIRAKMEELKERFPAGVEYRIVYDTTVFVKESIASVFHTLIEAFILVFIVVLVFLQNWRATVIPMIAVPVSLIGTLAFMSGLGFSLNNLSLFGMVLAIGIVVDDAIVVVEGVERWLAQGLSPRDASRKTMDEVTGPVIGISLVLCAVFVPTSFMAGISGQFFRQFALTIAASTVISAFNSLTLSPALCALILKPHAHGNGHQEVFPRLGVAVIGGLLGFALLSGPLAGLLGMEQHGAAEGSHGPAAPTWVRALAFAIGAGAGAIASPIVNRCLSVFFKGFNKVFDFTINGYGNIVAVLLRLSFIALLVYGGLIGLTVLAFQVVPAGFIPEQDKGYLVVNAQLPDGASLQRTDALIAEMSKQVRDTPGVAYTIEVPGYSILLGSNLSNVGGMFVILDPFEKRKGADLSAKAILKELRDKFSAFRQARIGVFGAPPIDGLGSTGGFKLQIQDRRGAGLRALQGAAQNLAFQGNQDPRLIGLFTSFSVAQPQVYVDIDREKAKAMKISLDDIHMTLQSYLGSLYVNDFTFQNRNWQVNVQAAPDFRMRIEDIGRLEVRNAQGERVPLRGLIKVKLDSGPAIVNHYNLFPSAEINGATAPGTSSSQAIAIMDQLSKEFLPATMSSEWTELSYQQILASRDVITKLVFPLAVVFVFLVLAAQYESLSLPMAIILIVPMCILASLTGVWLATLDNNIFVQIGLVVLIGLAAKNAILIVEFAKQVEDQGKERHAATIEACRLRLRPILMTSFAFILGVVPLVLASGAGAEMRFTLGLAVFSGMLGVTFFGIFLTPVFYYVIRWLTSKSEAPGKGTTN